MDTMDLLPGQRFEDGTFTQIPNGKFKRNSFDADDPDKKDGAKKPRVKVGARASIACETCRCVHL